MSVGADSEALLGVPAGRKIIDMIVEHVAKNEGEPFIAFECFPPKTPATVQELYETVPRFQAQNPFYVDVTWGAGGTTATLTLELVTEFKKRFGVEPNMHLTCTNQTAELTRSALETAKASGIRNIVALRGDPPAGKERWEATEGGFSSALDLVKYIRATHGDYFCLSVAGYPEGHPNRIKKVEDVDKLSNSERSRLVYQDDGEYVCHDDDFAIEIAYLKEKVDAGADFIITQLFFDVNVFLDFVKACRDAGITCPIMPGIMPIMSYGGLKRMCGFCKTRIPRDLAAELELLKKDEAGLREYGIRQGVQLCQALLDSRTVPGLHFYTLNKEETVFKIMNNIGLLKGEAASKLTSELQAAAAAGVVVA
jgi:methylenetetrahydrofolate reductase (NADPH)